MEYVMIGLLVLSVVLYIISGFLKDPFKNLKEEIEQVSMQQIQDMYVVKKKIKVLEEELLAGNASFQSSPRSSSASEKKEVHEIIKNQVWSLYQQGLTYEQIAKQASLTTNEVESILTKMWKEGVNNE